MRKKSFGMFKKCRSSAWDRPAAVRHQIGVATVTSRTCQAQDITANPPDDWMQGSPRNPSPRQNGEKVAAAG